MWMTRCQDNNIPINWKTIVLAGKDFARELGYSEDAFTGSNGWQYRFKNRFDLARYKIHGESGSADISSASVAKKIAAIQETLKAYEPRDIYNMDETAVFYCNPPTTTIASGRIEGVKQDKTRMTVALTVNADSSDFREPVFIGKTFTQLALKRKTVCQCATRRCDSSN